VKSARFCRISKYLPCKPAQVEYTIKIKRPMRTDREGSHQVSVREVAPNFVCGFSVITDAM
jgi:hypothetical protein